MDLRVNRNADIESTPSNNMFVNSDLGNIDYKKIYVWLNQCLDSKNLLKDSETKDRPEYLFVQNNNIRLVCSKIENKTSFEIKGYEFQLNGYVKS